MLRVAALPLIPFACRNSEPRIAGSIVGGPAGKGHRLRSPITDRPAGSIRKKIVIVGGGVAGLIAAYRLKQQGVEDFVLLELNNEVGGNALSGQNNVSRYPWGAHYLPVPDHRDRKLLSLLESFGAVTGYDQAGLPYYNEEFLCFDPEERLYINGYWQDGLVPRFGVSAEEAQQIDRFFREIDHYRQARGADGKDAFCFPVSECSADEMFLSLDRVTFAGYLQSKGYTSPHLLWYLDYCTKDDYGGTAVDVSAWAGIHYFAARKGKAANADHDTVLTWPEGNAWLVNKLREKVSGHIITDALVFRVEESEGMVRTHFLRDDTCEEVLSEKAIVATPQFITQRIVRDHASLIRPGTFRYAPWMVANITIDTYFEHARGQPMSWDNVFYGSRSLGYVNACHQHIRQAGPQQVLTYYHPLCDSSPATERDKAMGRSHEEWVKLITDDLRRVHPGMIPNIRQIDVWLWGHGMVLPCTGLQEERIKRGRAPVIAGRICLAHSDLSGISVFEEAFHQGWDAAGRVLEKA